MKKTLIAAAALAFVGAASAQVTLSGTYGFEFAKQTGAKASFGMHDAAVKVTATDDLGGGLKVTVAGGVNNFGGRNQTAVAREDASVTVAGGFGTVMMGDIETGNGIIGRGQAGAPLIGADNGTVLSGASNNRIVKYAAPAIGGLNFSVSATNGGGVVPDAAYTFGVSTTMGALTAGIDTTDFRSTAVGRTDRRVRLSATYDAGSFKVGFGSEKNGTFGSTTAGTAVQQDSYTLGASTVLGTATVGAAYSKNSDNGAASTEFGVSYPLSKRTSISAAYQNNNMGAADKMRARFTSTF